MMPQITFFIILAENKHTSKTAGEEMITDGESVKVLPDSQPVIPWLSLLLVPLVKRCSIHILSSQRLLV